MVYLILKVKIILSQQEHTKTQLLFFFLWGGGHIFFTKGFPGGSAVKNLPAIQETQVQSLDWEDPLEKGMATHSSILAWNVFFSSQVKSGFFAPSFSRRDTDFLHIWLYSFFILPSFISGIF